MFLCSHCKTEQRIDKIVHEGLKECRCPNCREVCCDDYCVFFSNGRWAPTDAGMFLDPSSTSIASTRASEFEKANAAYSKAMKQYNEAYMRTKREYGIEE